MTKAIKDHVKAEYEKKLNVSKISNTIDHILEESFDKEDHLSASERKSNYNSRDQNEVDTQ